MKNNNEKIRKILFNEVSFFVSIIGVVIGCVLFVSKPDSEMRMDIAMIEQRIHTIEFNHLKSIETDIDEIEMDIDEINDAIVEINLTLAKILIILENEL